MRALIVFLIFALLVFAGCKKAALPSEDTIQGIDEQVGEAADAQDVLNENVSDIDTDLGTVSGDPSGEVQSAVPQNEVDAMESDLQEIESMESDLDPSQFEDSPTI